MYLPRPTSRLSIFWSASLLTIFLVLCLRFQFAAITQAAQPFAVLVLGASCLALGYFEPDGSLFAFIVSFPLLNGLGAVHLLEAGAPASLVFSALFLGLSASRLGRPAARETGERPSARVPGRAMLAADLLITAVLLSLAWQAAHHWRAGEWTGAAWRENASNFESPFYPLNSAFVWLQGLFFFRLLCSSPALRCLPLGKILAVFGLTIGVFLALQFFCGMPVPYQASVALSQPVYYSPFEDIHSFGSVIVALLAFSLAAFPRRAKWSRTRFLGWSAAATALAVLAALSWSRATWLSAIVSGLLIAGLRLRQRWSALLGALVASGLAAFEIYSARHPEGAFSYARRLDSLLKLESLAAKGTARTDLYRKSLAMIREHPWTGSGIGSFFLRSPAFARPGDPLGAAPNFAHNFLLQLAAELGLPATALFLGLIVLGVGRGLTATRAAYAAEGAVPSDLTVAGATIGLVAYLFTQMTANSLNIYISNQFFFWLLLAVILIQTEPTTGS